MDSLDKVTTTSSTPAYGRNDDLIDTVAPLAEEAEAVIEEAAETVRKVNWLKVAGYAAAGLAVAGAIGGYAYWRNQQKKPTTRLGRLRDKLGLAEVDIRDLRSTYNRVDFDKLNQSRRELGTYAKKATHAGAKKVAAWTR